jgi:7-carboxy-7-deazaguanine synthase
MEDLVVNEIFHSIQGESSHTGRPCVFVRLTYCNLRCSYCDTEYAFEEGSRKSILEIIKEIGSFRCRLVEITGGEPLVQEGSLDLMRRLCDSGYEVLLETGGSLDIGRVDRRVKRIVDFKCPGSGMAKKNLWSNVAHLRAGDEVKFVVRDRADFEWALDRIEEFGIDRCSHILFSPVFGVLEPVDLATWILKSGITARLQLQMHKFIWEPSVRGV